MSKEFRTLDWLNVQRCLNYDVKFDKTMINSLRSISKETKNSLSEARHNAMVTFNDIVDQTLIETLFNRWNQQVAPHVLYQETTNCFHASFEYKPSRMVELMTNGYFKDMLERFVYVEDYIAGFERACIEMKVSLPFGWHLLRKQVQKIDIILKDIEISMFSIMNVAQCVLHAAYIPNRILCDYLFKYLKSCKWTMEQKFDCSTLINDEIKYFDSSDIKMRTNPEEQLKMKEYYKQYGFYNQQYYFESPNEAKCREIINYIRAILYVETKTISKNEFYNWHSIPEAERLQLIKNSLSRDTTGEIAQRFSKFEEAEQKRRVEQRLIKHFHSLYDNAIKPIRPKAFRCMIYMIEQLYKN